MRVLHAFVVVYFGAEHVHNQSKRINKLHPITKSHACYKSYILQNVGSQE